MPHRELYTIGFFVFFVVSLIALAMMLGRDNASDNRPRAEPIKAVVSDAQESSEAQIESRINDLIKVIITATIVTSGVYMVLSIIRRSR